MNNYTIKVENDQVKYAVDLFFDNYKDAVSQFVNNVLKTETGSADAFVVRGPEGSWEVYQTAPDKGFVLAQVENGVQITEYKSLSSDAKYVVFDGQKLALFLKTEEGKPDIKVGHFLNLNEAVTQIDSESVKLAIDTIKAGIKNALVDQKKAEKKARQLKKKIGA